MTHLIIFVLGLAIGIVGCALVARNNRKKAEALLDLLKKKELNS